MALQTRLFKLTRKLDNVEEFNRIGERNLTTSIEVEDGTLAMYSCHLPQDEATCFVFEIYASQQAYEVHAASPQFKAYVAMAAENLVGREVFSLTPELLLEKPAQLKVTDGSASPRCCFVTIRAGHIEHFREAVFENMRASVEGEEGVLVLYAAHLADDESRWVFWELYASEEAYAAHRETEHFRRYIERTADDLDEKELIPLVGDCLVSKGSLQG